MSLTPLEKRLRWAGVLISVGLIVQLLTLRGYHPLAFVAFIAIACPLILAGMVLFLYAILKRSEAIPAVQPPAPGPGGSSA
ncbi:MAG: hypothetical protein KGN76_05245 [Acidobacteriota bacterium]|nr:hypothetical protein [Acidobacteriota bacterium]